MAKIKRFKAKIGGARASIRPRRATRELDRITIKSGSESITSSDFLYELIGARKAGFEEVEIDISAIPNNWIFPNVAVPICALMEIGKDKTDFLPIDPPHYAENMGLFDPYETKSKLAFQHSVLDKIWSYETSDDTTRLTRALIDEIYRAAVVETEGVLAALEWCLGEVLENVVLHSEASKGFVMGQIHKKQRHVAFSVVDLGQGIERSLLSSGQYHPTNPVDAITLAMREGVTRDKKSNQGNGLWGMHNIMVSNTGLLTIISGGGGITINGKNTKTFNTGAYGFQGGGTIIDFQFELDKPVALQTVLGGYIPKPVNIVVNADERGDINYLLKDQKLGFGTREAGERLRNEILNLSHQTTGKIIVNFEEIGVITSSFADELIGKLYAQFGPINFSKTIDLVNMSDAVQAVVDRAIVQRMSTELHNDQ